MKGASNIEVGDIFTSKQGSECKVIEYKRWDYVKVKFTDDMGFEYICRASHLKGGNFRNPYHPTVQGLGYIGLGGFKTRVGGRKTKEYSVWGNTMVRSYCGRYQELKPNYKGCSVHPDWWDYQVFAKWYTEHEFYGLGYELDKDLLVRGNKVYSPETCTMLPREINMLLTGKGNMGSVLPQGVSRYNKGKKFLSKITIEQKVNVLGCFNTPEEAFVVYKNAKESYIKSVANNWKNKIEPKAFQALINYEVLPSN